MASIEDEQTRVPIDFSSASEREKQGILAESTLEQQGRASFDLMRMDTLTQASARAISQEAMEEWDLPQLSPEELNQKFPGLDKPFEEPMNEVAAANIAKIQEKRKKLQSIMARGDEGFVGKLNMLGSGIVASLSDPTELILGGLTSYGIGNIAKGAVAGSRAAKAAQYLQQGTLTNRLVDGLVAATISEAGTLTANRSQLIDYTIEDAAYNAVVGTVAIGTGIHLAGKAWGRIFQRPEKLTEHLEDSVGALESGKSVDTTIREKVHAEELDGFKAPDGTVKKHRFKPAPDDATFKQMPLYAASSKPAKNFMDTETFVIGDGADTKSLYVTSNPHTANGYASSKSKKGAGGVYEISVDNLKIIDADAKMPKDLEVSLRQFVQSYLETGTKKGKIKAEKALRKEIIAEILEAKTFREAFDALSRHVEEGNFGETTIRQFKEHLMKDGFDGARRVTNKVVGAPAKSKNKQHLVEVFDKSKATQKRAAKGDQSTTIDTPKEAFKESAEAAQKYETNMHADKDAPTRVKEFAEIDDAPTKSPEAKEIDAEVREKILELEEKQAAGTMDDFERALYKDLTELDPDEFNKVIKSAISCVGKNG
jgi:hypothetical protein